MMKLRILVSLLAIVPVLVLMQNCGSASSKDGGGDTSKNSTSNGMVVKGALKGACVRPNDCLEIYSNEAFNPTTCTTSESGSTFTAGATCTAANYDWKCDYTTVDLSTNYNMIWFYKHQLDSLTAYYKSGCDSAKDKGAVWAPAH